ncbi:hypothetical protein Vretifemale_4102 [Volvox reticuliferus]|nr:hypothetical protein Vretifemale_4102 [Volvox reticuliferus]
MGCNATYLASSRRPAMLSLSPSAAATPAARAAGDSASALNFREAKGIAVTVAGAPATATRTPLHAVGARGHGQGHGVTADAYVGQKACSSTEHGRKENK